MNRTMKFQVALAVIQSQAYRAAMRKARKLHPNVRLGIRMAWAQREANKRVAAEAAALLGA